MEKSDEVFWIEMTCKSLDKSFFLPPAQLCTSPLPLLRGSNTFTWYMCRSRHRVENDQWLELSRSFIAVMSVKNLGYHPGLAQSIASALKTFVVPPALPINLRVS